MKLCLVAWLSNEAIVVCGVIQGLWLFSPGTDGPEYHSRPQPKLRHCLLVPHAFGYQKTQQLDIVQDLNNRLHFECRCTDDLHLLSSQLQLKETDVCGDDPGTSPTQRQSRSRFPLTGVVLPDLSVICEQSVTMKKTLMLRESLSGQMTCYKGQRDRAL